MSYVVISAKRCSEAANNVLERIRSSRERQREKLIQKRMSSWFFPAKTREKAIKQLKSEGCLSDWHLINFHAAIQEDDAKDLLKLAQAGDPVHVSERHIDLFE